MSHDDPLSELPAGVCLIGFGAAWCTPWQLLQPTLQTMTAEGIAVRTVDVDTHADPAEKYRIVVLPTLCLLRDGREIRRTVGAVSPEDLRALVRYGISSAPRADKPRRRRR